MLLHLTKSVDDLFQTSFINYFTTLVCKTSMELPVKSFQIEIIPTFDVTFRNVDYKLKVSHSMGQIF